MGPSKDILEFEEKMVGLLFEFLNCINVYLMFLTLF